jgi:hypothetical protein
MEHYVTLLDGLFLPQALALHASAERHAGEYRLWVLCVDEQVEHAFERLRLPNVSLLRLAEMETSDLRRVKPTRSRGEYCWTLTPFAPRFVFEADPLVARVTYVDADMWFRQSPARVFHEFQRSGKQVMLTEHNYAAEYQHFAGAGRFCVQFMTFTRSAEDVRRWWEERCVEWCFARLEEGKFGDQKYLDDWPERFQPSVHVLADAEAFQAPWNAVRFAPSSAVAYHFHGLRLLTNGRVAVAVGYRLPRSTYDTVYRPYLADLAHSVMRLRTIGCEVRPQLGGWRVQASARLASWRALCTPWNTRTVPGIARLDRAAGAGP